MKVATDRVYSQEHVWLRFEGNVATLGVTPKALTGLGAIKRINIEPNARTPALYKGQWLATIYGEEDHLNLMAPVALEFLENNPRLLQEAELVRSNWSGEGWILKAAVDPRDEKSLLTPARYTKLVAPKAKSRRRTLSRPVGFADLNFKLSVVSELMDLDHYVRAIHAIAKKAVGAEPGEPVFEVMDYVARLVMSPRRLAEITRLEPDGGDPIYRLAAPTWDGGSDAFGIFDITSLRGIEKLVNLETFAPIALVCDEGLDYSPLLRCKSLKRVDFSSAADSVANEAVREKLARRGVELSG